MERERKKEGQRERVRERERRQRDKQTQTHRHTQAQRERERERGREAEGQIRYAESCCGSGLPGFLLFCIRLHAKGHDSGTVEARQPGRVLLPLVHDEAVPDWVFGVV